MDYFLADGNTRRGPFPAEMLLRQGMRADTLVWREGMPQWLPAEQVPELRDMLHRASADTAYGHQRHYGHAAQQYPPPYPQQGMSASNINGTKLAAGLCGILLGSLGVHKFILGMPVPGLIMLLVSVLVGPFTCFSTWGVMSIIGIIEGIIYLTKTDEEFYQMYMVEKKQWF